MHKQFENLANAIIVRAVKDYKENIEGLKNDPENIRLLVEKKKLENFFYSEWYHCLSDADPNYILERIRNESLVGIDRRSL